MTNDEFLSIVPTECHLTIAAGFTGASGFKDAHTQADRLRRVAEAQTNKERSVLSSADEGALTAAAFIDRIPLAHNLIWSVLGELSASDEYSFAIRETARSFLKNGISGAAKDMVIHRNTVKYRVDKFRDALGTRDINGAEVRLALELSHWLNNAETN
ncbi:helix-turn-helix domain-containing protein [Corynebacterium sp. MSK297]|uniref:helix-turn-helix domain-containing protein n=1 Tax=Corynebacterium sp. MSK297 TaxID=3050221 RepID=UPI002550650C|nr:helix-turn-helix domain-containing protein [Corynebacterium sp. MSK297]MDK8846106.1 helix-turn-helix domain-containing protein [Corynebacterium sp. MSK297]